MSVQGAKALGEIVERFALESLSPPVDLTSLAVGWGVTSIEQRDISSDAMLMPSVEGFKVALKKASTAGEKVRQRFSLAHELGHLLLGKIGYSEGPRSRTAHVARDSRNSEERLCDQIAAEILMPRQAFADDASGMGWSLSGIRHLTRKYDTSVQATARRLLNLMPETCHMGIWKPATSELEMHRLVHSLGQSARYGIKNPTSLPRRRLWLISRAANGSEVETGVSPLTDRSRPSAFPKDVPAEAWAWGREDYRNVLVFYYPERELSDNMSAVSNATWRAF